MANMVDIDEAELASLRNVAGLFNKTLNSKGRDKLLRALKEANPDLPVPEIDAREPVMEEIRTMNTSLAEMKKQLEEEKAAREEEKRLATLNSRWSEGQQKAIKLGYTGEALTALEKFMEERGVADHEVAAAAFEKLHPTATPINNSSTKFDFFSRKSTEGDVMAKQLWDDPDGFRDNMTGQILREMRGAA